MIGRQQEPQETLGVEDAQTEESSFRSIVESMPQIAYVSNADGSLEYVNARWEEYTGEKNASPDALARVVHAEDLGGMHQAWKIALTSGKPLHFYFRLKRLADGQYRWHLSRTIPISSPEGTIKRWYGTSTDVDDIKRAEEALRSLDERRDAFLATLAHELRNPLAPLKSGLEVLRLAGDSRHVVTRTREAMERQVRQLTRLIDDLMEVSRLVHGRSTLQMTTLDLTSVVELALETARPALEANGNSVSLTGPETPLVVRGDSVRLVQVLSNVLDNAAKFTVEGHVEVVLLREGNKAVVEVVDDGVGIAAEALPSIFTRFGQAKGSSERTRAGLGIGLYLVRKLVEAHGGAISATSDGPGLGTRVRIDLPLVFEKQREAS